nr:SH3 domain-containing protein [Auraticoccus cholistanensis]
MVVGRARRGIREPLAPRVVRRLPQVAAGLATLVLLGSAVGAEARVSAEPVLLAVPAQAPEVTRQQSAVLDAARSAVQGARVHNAAEARAAEQRAAEKKAEEKAAEKKAAEKKAAAKEAAEKKAAAEAAERTRQQRASRDTARTALSPSQLGAEAGTRWTTVDLNARAEPDAGSTLLQVLDAGESMTVTERTSDGWRQIELDGRAAWVAGKYLTDEEPRERQTGGSGAGSGGVSGGSCPSGSGVEAGLQPNAIAVHRAICAAFPSITSYGGQRADSVPGHPEGRAIDAMIPGYSSSSGNALGWEVAEYVRANAGRLGVTEVIFDQKIWTTQRAGEGWRSMGNRGSDTANHRDHVHVTTR